MLGMKRVFPNDERLPMVLDRHGSVARDISHLRQAIEAHGDIRMADQEIERSTNEMEEAKAEALLVEQRELQERNRTIGDARRQVVTVTKEAERRKTVAVTQAEREFEVGKLELEAATKQAAAIRSRGQAEANVVLYEYQARAEPLATAVRAFGGGATYAQQFFLQRVAPSITSILSNTDGPFAEIFKQFQSFPDASSQGGDR